MWKKREYIFGYPQGEPSMEIYYRKEYEAFQRFMKTAIGLENMEGWIVVKQMRLAISQVVDSLL